MEVPASTRLAPTPKRRLFPDIQLGLRVGNVSAVRWAVANEPVDLIVLDASSLPAAASTAPWRSRRTRLLLDPNTDLLAADHARVAFPHRVANAWKWQPDPIQSALLSGGKDAQLVSSILDWQESKQPDALITPYIRIEDWNLATPPTPSHLDRTEAILTAAAAHASGGKLPLFGAVALRREAILRHTQRNAILQRLTKIDGIDGLYVVAQAPTSSPPWHRAGWLSGLKALGDGIHAAGLEAILAYGGPELVPLLASGAWDAGVTGNSRLDRYPTFRLQNGQPPIGVPIDRLFAFGVLEDVPVPTLSYVAPKNRSLVVCGCDGCRQIVDPAGVIGFDPDCARQHYLASMVRWVAWLRRTATPLRFAALSTRLDAFAAAAETAEKGMTTTSMGTGPRFEFWKNELR